MLKQDILPYFIHCEYVIWGLIVTSIHMGRGVQLNEINNTEEKPSLLICLHQEEMIAKDQQLQSLELPTLWGALDVSKTM